MDLQQARTLLQRINRVFDDFKVGDAAPSALERDLLKEYVRRFYESLSDETAANYRNGGRPKQQGGDVEQAATEPTPPREKTRRPLSGRQLRKAAGPASPSAPVLPRATVAAPPVVQAVPVNQAPRTPAPVQVPAPAPVPAPKPAMIEVPESVEEDVRSIEAASPALRPASGPAPVAAPSAPTTALYPSAPISAKQSLASLEPALRELFAYEVGTDLGDRLGNAPVADLTRAMGLNQRLVAQNQLFGKDAAALRDTLVELNNKDDYEDAALALVGTARKHEWTEPERSGAARDFLKLVRRRYASS